jgi:hypothetical protein
MKVLELGHKRPHFAFFKPKTQFFGDAQKVVFYLSTREKSFKKISKQHMS